MPISDSGTVTAGITVAQKLRRKRKITITTRATVSISVNWTSATDARMVWVRSERIDTLIAGGIEASSCGSNALIWSTVSITLAPGTRWIARMIARLLVVPAGQQLVSPAPDRLADIANAHRRAVAIGDDQLCILLRLQELVVGVEREGLPRAVERALRQIDIGLAEHGAHVLQADAARRQRLRIDLDPDRRLLLAADADLAHTGDLRDLRQQDVLRIGIDRGQRQGVRGQARAA